MSLESRIAVAQPKTEELECVTDLRDELLAGRLIECLDDGFIRLVDVMGGDAAIVQAARVSYGKGTKKKSDDRNLIRFLMRNWHTTPLLDFKFHVLVPMDHWRQWIRHRTASVNESCIRYSVATCRVVRFTDAVHAPRRRVADRYPLRFLGGPAAASERNGS